MILVGTANDCLVRQKGPSPDHIVRFDVLGFIDVAAHPNRRALGSLADLESVLLEQPFVKDQAITVGELVTRLSSETKEKVQVRRFTRYKMGEGLEKKTDDFAGEVAAAVQ